MRFKFALAAALLAAPIQAHSQCADGSPPPCATQRVAAATRRPDPPMDPKTWIVVPFDNLNNNQEVDWLRGGSVNLLYLGMSRWTDLRVIDDERVADYMRDVLGAVDARSLTANQAIAIAKRAGAAQVVMGDVLKLGNRVTVNAKIYDVKTGQRTRSVREETNSVDSLMAVYSRLSQKVLNVPLPTNASAGAVVTNSIEAYREYSQGMAALNRFELPDGEAHLKKALQLDSTFALAHAKLAVLLGWIAPSSPAGRQHAEAAGRLSASLPPREQALVKASVAFARNDYVASCAGFRGLIKSDSTDTDAWYGLGDCLYHDNAMTPIGGDSTKPTWRGNRNESLRAFRQTLALDPTYHLAYQHIADLYTLQLHGGQWCVAGKCTRYVAVVRPSGDSLLLVPLAMPQDTAVFREHMQDYVRRGARREMLTAGRTLAERWLAASPSEGRARMVYAGFLSWLGDLVGADTNMRRTVVTDSANAGVNAMILRLELNVKLGRPADALRMYDSVRAHSIPISGPSGQTSGGVLTLASPLFGRMSHFDSLMDIGLRQSRASPVLTKFAHEGIRVMVGAAPDTYAASATAFFNELSATAGRGVATATVASRFGLSLRSPRDQWPTFDTTRTEPILAPVLAVMRQDTAALRSAAKRLDSLSAFLAGALLSDTATSLIAAEAYLTLKDSARALDMTRRWLDVVVPYSGILQQGAPSLPQALYPRTARLRADLAAALGHKDEARLWYDRFLALWAKPDDEFLPIVESVRKARAALSP